MLFAFNIKWKDVGSFAGTFRANNWHFAIKRIKEHLIKFKKEDKSAKKITIDMIG